MYDALDVAKYVITHCKNTRKPVSNLKLQKLLYFVQAQFLVGEGHPCFFNRIEAWDLGPVVPDVYHCYKANGGNAIVLIERGNFGISLHDRRVIEHNDDRCNFYTASQLVYMTHAQEPWIQARKKGYNAQITNSSIEKFFSD